MPRENREVFREALAKANARLKAAKIRVRIREKKGSDRLYLRGTLPPKPGSDREEWSQQDVSIGCYATIAGLRTAEKLARKMASDLDMKDFDWADWGKPKAKQPEPETIGEWVAAFVANYRELAIQQGRDPVKIKRTLETNFLSPFAKLPKDDVLDSQILRQTLLQTEPSSRSRRRGFLAYRALLRFAEMDFSFLDPLRGNYSTKDLKRRNPPSDRTILIEQEKIDDPSWLWAYRTIATFGLRPSEIWLIDLEEISPQKPCLQIRPGGKTGARTALAFPSAWWEEWELWKTNVPTSNTNKFARIFSRYGVSFRPYDLRHAHALRMSRAGVPLELAARSHGHSVAIHTQIYLRWMEEGDMLEVLKRFEPPPES